MGGRGRVRVLSVRITQSNSSSMRDQDMAQRRKTWIYSPPKPPKPKVPDAIKAEVEAKARQLVESVLKPTHVKPPPEDMRWNTLWTFLRNGTATISTSARSIAALVQTLSRHISRWGSPVWSMSTVILLTCRTCGTRGSGGSFIQDYPWMNVWRLSEMNLTSCRKLSEVSGSFLKNPTHGTVR